MHLLVRLGLSKRVGELNGQLDRAPHVQCAAVDEGAQRLARHELEDEKPLAHVFADFEQLRDVGVRNSGRCGRGVQQRAKPSPIRNNVDRQHLDGHRAAQACIARAKHLAEPTGAERREHFVVRYRVRHGAGFTSSVAWTDASRPGLAGCACRWITDRSPLAPHLQAAASNRWPRPKVPGRPEPQASRPWEPGSRPSRQIFEPKAA